MPKTIRNVFDSKLTYINFYYANERASKHKTFKKQVLIFNRDLEDNLTNLLNSIKNDTYKIGRYNEFIIYEPKERTIKSLPYRDRIVHQWYIEEFIKPYVISRFIEDSYACIDNKGTHKAALKVQNYMRKMNRKHDNYFILKCDIKKYFYSIDKNILFDILKKFIKDIKLLEFSKKMIFDDNNEIGLPIGNYTSQYFANIYLNELDYYAKHVLKLKYYVRYMDDFVILLNDKEQSIIIKDKIEIFLKDKLKLQYNEKSRYYPNKMGVNFCGYRIFETHMLLRNSSKNKIKKQIKKWNKMENKNVLDFKKVEMSWNSWIGHAKHCNSYKLINKMHNKIIIKEKLKK